MNLNTQNQKSLIEYFVSLIRFDGDNTKFWDEYVKSFALLCKAERAVLTGLVNGEWKIANSFSIKGDMIGMSNIPVNLLEHALEKKIAAGQVDGVTYAAVALDVGTQEQPPIIVAELGKNSLTVSENTIYLIASIPSLFQAMRLYKKARVDVLFFARLLQVVSSVSEDKKFNLAALRICNETASLFGCDQVSLGWIDNKNIKLKSISNMESFDYRANSVWELEGAMEECADQDSEILWPQKNDKLRMNAHEAYCKIRRIGSALSLPIRRGNKVIGVITCERGSGEFNQDEIWRLRLLLEQVAAWLEKLSETDIWFGKKIYKYAKNRVSKLFMIEKTGLKVLVAAAFIALLIMFIPFWSYNVDGTFILNAEKTVHITSPIDGYIEKVYVSPGDAVKPGSSLLDLDKKQLYIEQASKLAMMAKHNREAEKAESENSLADMRIAQLMAEEVFNELKIIEFKLENSSIKSPFSGIVVEGDLKSRLGSPVRQGDVLMKIASLYDLSFEILIDEKDIYDFNLDSEVRLKFVGKPDFEFSAKVIKIIPKAVSVGGKNVFKVEAKISDVPEKWWRPGMSGVAKIEAGRRSLWWVITHDAVNYLKINFWL